ncbi:MAG TPA: CehA/McbA family metallohydrolase [Armatimonadota bacterium]|nr:CehA/McbA family metallohydrolase [Armatimonadota bacterium]
MEQRPLVGFHIVAPSTVAVGEAFDLKLKCLTTPHPVAAGCYRAYPRLVSPFNLSPRGFGFMDNVVARWRGPLLLNGGPASVAPREVACETLSGTFADDERALGVVSGLSFREPGTHTFTITDPRTGISGRSNPIEVTASAPDLRLYWGDLHSQTFFSDGLRMPEELYHFAQHEGFLDVFALSDHFEWLTDAQWEYFTRVTNDFDKPGRYVTFVGVEWTSSKHGHRNIYYPGSGGPVLRANDPGMEHLEQLFAAARQHRALVVPHHSANAEMGVNWDGLHDPEHERLVEIYSIWGNSECPAQDGNPRPILPQGGERRGQHVVDAVARGRKLGFIGGGDIHDGRPGDDLHMYRDWQQPSLTRRQGTMGVWARELTREAVWEALWNRRVYATTNVRVILRFEVCGAPMGQTVSASGPRSIRVRAASELPIARVEVVRDGREAFTLTPDACEVDWAAEDAATDAPTYYYARVTRTDGEMAWSSPVWVTVGAPTAGAT